MSNITVVLGGLIIIGSVGLAVVALLMLVMLAAVLQTRARRNPDAGGGL
jgi:hypothetical protein